MALGPFDPLVSKFLEHPVVWSSSALGWLAMTKRFSSRAYGLVLRGIRETVPEIHGAIIDARIKMAQNRRRLEKATMPRD